MEIKDTSLLDKESILIRNLRIKVSNKHNLQPIQLKTMIQVQKRRPVLTRVYTNSESKGENSFEDHIFT